MQEPSKPGSGLDAMRFVAFTDLFFAGLCQHVSMVAWCSRASNSAIATGFGPPSTITSSMRIISLS